MKTYFLTIIVSIFLSNNSFAQSEKDTKDFIVENINSNPPKANYENFAFFRDNILEEHVKEFTQNTLFNTELDNLFIFAQDCHTGSDTSGNVWLSIAESIDIRGITKISTTRKTGKDNYYSINVYLSGNYFSKKYKYLMNKAEYDSLLKMEILISDNSEIAKKLKKAIIHLGKLKGVTIADGDLF
jgi:hypothetical protein